MPYFPLEGQLISQRHRLLRPWQNISTEASRILLEHVAVSEVMVTQETERYMFRVP